ncbi:PorP/SprF family type IX secretion system membrane protein [Bacteroidales bacterium AH-315-N07]|nr:PorP/SprF family type IX secretion system membrane protein [Bacteroidales bacterium AH-315-N07]
MKYSKKILSLIKRRKYLYVIIITLIQHSIFNIQHLHCQDFHFSQYFHSPINLNPALTGHFEGNYRIILNHRNQWSSITVPFLTSSISVDTKFYKDWLQGGALGVGLMLFNDKTGDAGLTHNKMMLSLNYFKLLDYEGNHAIALGFQGGFFQKGLDQSKLLFGNQFVDADFDRSLPTGENIAGYKILKPDFQTGVLYKLNKPDHHYINGGISFFHLTSPDESLIGNEDRLSLRSVLHGEAKFKIAEKTFLGPNLLLMYQNGAREINIGATLDIAPKEGPSYNSKLILGTYYRVFDALILMTGLEYENWLFAFSYDVNVSSLRVASNFKGGFEISIIYTDRWPPGRKKLPIVIPCIRL